MIDKLNIEVLKDFIQSTHGEKRQMKMSTEHKLIC